MALEAGQQLLHYRLIDKIGEGGMGVVWKAEDTTLHRHVALKVLPAALAADSERLARFEREAKLLASLNHPNIATVHGLHEHDGVQFLVMELVPGEDLAERLDRGAIPVQTALEVSRQIAEALETAHEAGVIHRDLKPANVKRTPDGKIKVLDFGLAKGIERADASSSLSMSPTMTSAGSVAGMILGTAAYMSPEQARGKPLDRRTDIWSFGCLLYEMLTGVKPFDGETVSDSIARILQIEPDEALLPAATPHAVRRLLRRCLVKDPRRRLRDIGDARIEIEEAASADGEDNAAGATDSPSGSAAIPSAGARPAWIVAGLAAIVAAVALVSLVLRGTAEPAIPETFVSIAAPRNAVYHALAGPPALTPDGRRLAFLARDAEGHDRLWVRDLSSPTARPLEGTDHAYAPFWAPDGSAIGFFAARKLKRIDVESGFVETLADAPLAAGGSWSSNGTILFSPTWTQPLTRIPETGGTAEPLVQADDEPEGWQTWPWFLPDGERYLFTRNTGREEGEIRVGFLDGRASRPVMTSTSNAAFAAPNQILWWHDGALRSRGFDPGSLELTGQPRPVAAEVMFDAPRGTARFSASAVGTIVYQEGGRVQPNQLVWYDRKGAVLGDAGPPDNHYAPRISSDGAQVSVDLSNDRNNGDIWVLDLARGGRARFTSNPNDESAPIWSPDGERVAYYGRVDERTSLFVKPTRRAGEEQLDLGTNIKDARPTDWSRDGGSIIVTAWETEATPGDLWIYSFDDRGATRLTETPYEDRDGTFSPDASRIAFASDETGQYEIYVAPVDDVDRRVRISTEGGLMPMWSRDGREIFFVAPDERLMSAPVEDAAGLRIGIPVPLFRTRIKEHRFRQYDVTTDGRRFLVNTVVGEETREPLTLVLGWGAGD